jgi:hypothetical protein
MLSTTCILREIRNCHWTSSLYLRIAYRQNKPKYAWTLSLDLGNIIDHKNILRQFYDRDTGKLSYRYQMGFVPLLAFRVDFFAGRGRS